MIWVSLFGAIPGVISTALNWHTGRFIFWGYLTLWAVALIFATAQDNMFTAFVWFSSFFAIPLFVVGLFLGLMLRAVRERFMA